MYVCSYLASGIYIMNNKKSHLLRKLCLTQFSKENKNKIDFDWNQYGINL